MRTLCVTITVLLTLVIGISCDPARNPRSSSNDHWAHIISDYIRGSYPDGGNRDSGRHTTGSHNNIPFPILIVPVPVNVQSKDGCRGSECNNNFQRYDHDGSLDSISPKLAEQINERFGPQQGSVDDTRPQSKGHKTIIVKQQNRPNSQRPSYSDDPQDSTSQNYNPQPRGPQAFIFKHSNTPAPVNQQTRFGDVPLSEQDSLPQTTRAQDFRPQAKEHQTIIVKQPNSQPTPQPHAVYGPPASRTQPIIVRHPEPQGSRRPEDEDPEQEDEKDVVFPKDRKNNQIPLRPSLQNRFDGGVRAPDTSSPATSKELLEQFHNQFQHLRDPDLPPALIDREALEPTISESSQHLLSLFHSEPSYHQHQDLPPALIDRTQLDNTDEPDYFDEDPSAPAEEHNKANRQRVSSRFRVESTPDTPPTPRWDFSMAVRGELHVPMSDYTEPYQMWYNADTGASRIDFHEGGARTYRMIRNDGRVQRISMRIDRLGESNIPECRVGPPEQMSREDLRTPGLPDMSEFHFNGYDVSNNERWSRIVQTDDGRHGKTGEVLTYNHEMMVNRKNGKSMPVTYVVKVNSSMLGPNCDSYTHRYHEVTEMDQHADPNLFHFDIDKDCARQEHVDPSNPEQLVHLEPLREFTLPSRDLRYDTEIENYKSQFNRKYTDQTEESIRKNIFVQSSRFVLSGNRQSATFEMELNLLADRLLAEIDQILGVNVAEAFQDSTGFGSQIEEFPHPEPVVKKLSKKLPKKFDWRPRGAVTDVKWQGSCQSCWAFAVTGAVEGALFVRRKVLVPLSEQCLVDCGKPFGTHGCGGTWPRFAYDYVRVRGLPASEEYGPYTEKEEVCHEQQTTPVTRISAYVNVTQRSVPALQIAIRRHAPSVVIIDATAKSFIFYKRGVLYDDRCGKTLPKLNHAVLAVGWGEHRRKPHFILKNSWSAAWGEGGYIRVQGPANTCGVLEQPSYPRLEDSDVVTTAGTRQN